MGTDEEILVVPRRDLLWQGPFRGVLCGGLEEYLDRIRRFGFFRRRGDVEEDPSLKQVIPYLVVRRAGRYMLFQRTREGGEGRLHGLFSVGVGGHIARADVDGADDLVAAGLSRELAEELVVPGAWSARIVGVLNDDGNPVGSVHFGLVHFIDVHSGDVSIRETDRLTGRLATAEEVRAAYEAMETWSQLILDADLIGPR